jgi:hypothetical protein
VTPAISLPFTRSHGFWCRRKTAGDSGEQTDLAIAFIATTFLAGIKASEGAKAQGVAA